MIQIFRPFSPKIGNLPPLFFFPRCPGPQRRFSPAGMSQVQLQQFGCQYLCSMAQAMPDVREEILQNGGIRPLISAMNNYPQDEKGGPLVAQF